MEKFRERFLAVGFLTILFGLLLLHLLLPDAAVSYSERRKLAVPPEASADNLLSGKYLPMRRHICLTISRFGSSFAPARRSTRFTVCRRVTTTASICTTAASISSNIRSGTIRCAMPQS